MKKMLWTVGTVAVAVIIATILMKKFPQLSGGDSFEGEYELV